MCSQGQVRQPNSAYSSSPNACLAWKTIFHSSWRTFSTRFGPTLNNLKRHRDLLSDEKLTAAIVGVQDFRQSIEDKLHELSRKVQDLHLDNDKSRTLQDQEQLERQRQFVLSKLNPPDYHYDFERASKERQITPSGDWILNDTTYKKWTDTTNMEHRTLYLNGIPGAGQ